MSITFYEASITPLMRGLQNLRVILKQAKKHSEIEGVSEKDMLGMKLYEDMFDLKTQVQTIYFLAINQGVMLVAGIGPSQINSAPSSFADLDENLAIMLSDLEKVDADSYNAKMKEPVVCTLPMGAGHFDSAQNHMSQWVLPHTYFHITTAYDILRHNGVSLGKSHFLGNIDIKIVPA